MKIISFVVSAALVLSSFAAKAEETKPQYEWRIAATTSLIRGYEMRRDDPEKRREPCVILEQGGDLAVVCDRHQIETLVKFYQKTDVSGLVEVLWASTENNPKKALHQLYDQAYLALNPPPQGPKMCQWRINFVEDLGQKQYRFDVIQPHTKREGVKVEYTWEDIRPLSIAWRRTPLAMLHQNFESPVCGDEKQGGKAFAELLARVTPPVTLMKKLADEMLEHDRMPQMSVTERAVLDDLVRNYQFDWYVDTHACQIMLNGIDMASVGQRCANVTKLNPQACGVADLTDPIPWCLEFDRKGQRQKVLLAPDAVRFVR